MYFGGYDYRRDWIELVPEYIFAPSKDTIISRPEIYLKKAVSQLHFPGQCPIHRNHCVFSQQPLEIPLHMGV
jgi:hypothetical protein